MNQSLCSRADLLRALVSEHQGAAEGTANYIARSLGFEKSPESKQTTNDAISSISTERKASEPPPANEILQQFPDIPFWQLTACEFYQADQEESVSAGPAETQSSWQSTTEQIPPALASWSSIVPRIRQHLGASARLGRIDLTKTIKQLSRAEILSHFPRQAKRSWGNAVQVIVDRSTALTPYWQDQIDFCTRLEDLFPRKAIEYADYRQGYREPIVSGPRSGSQRYTPPAAGTLVILLGDLGLLSSATEQKKWRHLGQRLKKHQCRTLAIVPTKCHLSGQGLERYWRLLNWELSGASTSESESESGAVDLKVVERLLALISPATRIEPGFLRQVRRLIGADSAAEAAVWHHPALIGKSSVAASWDTARVQDFRDLFEKEDPNIREAVLKLLQGWRSHLPREIWYEEIISLQTGSQALLPNQNMLSDARQFFQDLGRKVGTGESIPGVLSWFRDVEQRLSKSAWQDEVIQPALHCIWWNTHQGEPEAVPPMDYDPKNRPASPTRPLRTFQLYQHSNALKIIEAPASSGQSNESGRGSWLGELKSRSGEIAVIPIESARNAFWKSGRPPAWASDWGEDKYGLWAAFSIEEGRGEVTQVMRWIAAGSFLMGSPDDEAGRWEDEGPQHEVRLSRGYWLFETAVSQALWQSLMSENPSEFKGPDLPVENVSWYDCQAFIEKLNTLKPGLSLALPGEAQWEYACRAGSRTPYSLGENLTPEQANYGNNSGKTLPVKNFQPNAWGLYQMHGNVWESCLDGQADYQNKEEIDPLGPTSEGALRVIRGGSWISHARRVRAACRYAVDPGGRNDNLGFRCSRVQPGAEPVEPWRSRSGMLRPETARNGGAGRVVLSQTVSRAQLFWPEGTDFSVRSDAGHLTFRHLNLPKWADAVGRDGFGLWAGFALEAKDGKVKQKLRWIPPGRFMMGSPKREQGGLAKSETGLKQLAIEGLQHPVTISRGYWLFDTPVTQALWEGVMANNPSKFPSPTHPLEPVSREEANEFIDKLNQKIPDINLNLPTEEQWEYACRANTGTSTYDGEIFESKKQADNTQRGPREGDLKQPNAWGLYDILVNDLEWRLDVEGQHAYQALEETDPVGVTKGDVERGGSWIYQTPDLSASYRFAPVPNILGFRCARVQEAEETKPGNGQGSSAERRPDL